MDLSGANLQGADLRNAEFVNVELDGADLCGADLTGVRLVNTDVSQAVTTGTVWNGRRRGGRGRRAGSLCATCGKAALLQRAAFLSHGGVRGACEQWRVLISQESRVAASLPLASGPVHAETRVEPSASAVSWGAILAGGAAAAAFSLILLILGTGLGLTSLSPYGGRGASAMALGFSAIVWVMVTQALASGLGGYLAGRLRTRWVSTASDEVFFRDTAHGFLAWAVATLVTAALLTTAIGNLVGGAVQAGAKVAQGAVAAVAQGQDEGDGPAAYFIDSMFRRPAAAAPAEPAAPVPVAEVGRILARTGMDQPLAAEDQRYLGQLVAERTGLSPQEAEARVADTVARMQTQAREAEAAAREAADKARKAGITATLWLFVSMLLGAFSAALAATWGGRERDA